MGENLKERFNALGEKIKVGGAEVGRKVTERMSSVSERMKDMFQNTGNSAPVNAAVDRLVEEATGAQGRETDWAKFMDMCDMINTNKIAGQDVARGLKKRIGIKDPCVQHLALTLLEALVKNCERMFSEVAAERVLEEMVKLIEDPQTLSENRDKALRLIEAWGEASDELRYLPVFEETYRKLRLKGVKFPGRDAESFAPIFTPPQSAETTAVRRGLSRITLRDVVGGSTDVRRDIDPEHVKHVLDVTRNTCELLSTVLTSSPQQEVLQEEVTMALVEQCRQSQFRVQRVIESESDGGGGEESLFEALIVNDELQKVLAKYEEMCSTLTPLPQPKPPTSQPALVNAQEEQKEEEPLNKIDPILVFGK